MWERETRPFVYGHCAWSCACFPHFRLLPALLCSATFRWPAAASQQREGGWMVRRRRRLPAYATRSHPLGLVRDGGAELSRASSGLRESNRTNSSPKFICSFVQTLPSLSAPGKQIAAAKPRLQQQPPTPPPPSPPPPRPPAPSPPTPAPRATHCVRLMVGGRAGVVQILCSSPKFAPAGRCCSSRRPFLIF